MAGIFVLRLGHGRRAQLGAQLRPIATDCPASPQVRRLETRVPPVGVEPTLGTLLGGRPLPLGYGGWIRIPRLCQIIRGRPMGGERSPEVHIFNSSIIGRCEELRFYPVLPESCTESSCPPG